MLRIIDQIFIRKNSEYKEDEMLKKDRIKISPLAKRIAIQNNINFREIEGTGPAGRIVKEDIESIFKCVRCLLR